MSQQTPTLAAQIRDRVGSRYAQRLRRSGQLPAVIYGHRTDPEHIAVNADEIKDMLRRGARLLNVEFGSDKTQTCLLKDVQYDWMGTNIIHVDLTRVDLSEQISVAATIEMKGKEQCVGLKEAGAFLEQAITNLEINCRADNIPESIVMDITNLEASGSITVGDLSLPDGVTCDLPDETSIIAIHISRGLAEDEEAGEGEGEAEGEGGAEPEVLSERKEDLEESDKK